MIIPTSPSTTTSSAAPGAHFAAAGFHFSVVLLPFFSFCCALTYGFFLLLLFEAYLGLNWLRLKSWRTALFP